MARTLPCGSRRATDAQGGAGALRRTPLRNSIAVSRHSFARPHALPTCTHGLWGTNIRSWAIRGASRSDARVRRRGGARLSQDRADEYCRPTTSGRYRRSGRLAAAAAAPPTPSDLAITRRHAFRRRVRALRTADDVSQEALAERAGASHLRQLGRARLPPFERQRAASRREFDPAPRRASWPDCGGSLPTAIDIRYRAYRHRVERRSVA